MLKQYRSLRWRDIAGLCAIAQRRGSGLTATLVQNYGIITSPALYHLEHDTIVAFQGWATSCPSGMNVSSVVALRISGGPQPKMQTAWCSDNLSSGAPVGTIVTTSDETADPVVWSIGAEGDNQLHGFRGDKGEELFKSDELPGLRQFVTILAAAGRLYFAGDGRIFAFGLAH
jgi:hypothetical protein